MNQPSTISGTKHLLVDLDGTLLGSRDLLLQAEFLGRTLKAFKGYGKGFRGWWKGLKGLSTLRSDILSTPESMIEGFTNDKRAIESLSRSLEISKEEAHNLLEGSVHSFFPKLERYFYPIPYAKDFLDWAGSHFTLTLATNPIWPEEIIRLRVKWAGIDPEIFTLITHNGNMHSCKPDPHYYREILAMREFEPHECLLIGNDLKMDLPATAVGIPTYILGKNGNVEKIHGSKGDRAPAWRGSFGALRAMLELQLNSRADSRAIG